MKNKVLPLLILMLAVSVFLAFSNPLIKTETEKSKENTENIDKVVQVEPTNKPTSKPMNDEKVEPTSAPTSTPEPTTEPTVEPVAAPTSTPEIEVAKPAPTNAPVQTQAPVATPVPTAIPTSPPEPVVTPEPTVAPTPAPTQAPAVPCYHGNGKDTGQCPNCGLYYSERIDLSQGSMGNDLSDEWE